MKINTDHVEEVDESLTIEEFVQQLNEKLKAIVGVDTPLHDARFQGFDFGTHEEEQE